MQYEVSEELNKKLMNDDQSKKCNDHRQQWTQLKISEFVCIYILFCIEGRSWGVTFFVLVDWEYISPFLSFSPLKQRSPGIN